MRARTLLLGLFLLPLFGCGRKPAMEYAPFRSEFGDFECLAPKDWAVETAKHEDAYRFTVWTGRDDRGALWGAPRFVAAWHAYGKPFKKASGDPGRYDSVEDFLGQMTATVWGPAPQFVEPRRPVNVDGRPAERLAVRFETDAYMSLPDAKPVSQGGGRLWRKDSTVIVPTRTGFYTFVFPSTEEAEARYRPAFEKLLESLRFVKESPVE